MLVEVNRIFESKVIVDITELKVKEKKVVVSMRVVGRKEDERKEAVERVI